MANDFADSEKGNSLGIAESRAHSRAPMRSLAYIELSDDNGGLILNISEDGLAMQAVQVVSPEQLSHMRFRLPKTSIPIEATGRLIWQLRSKKEAGIQFVNLSDEARQGIREWIGTESLPSADDAEAQQRKSAEVDKAESFAVVPEQQPAKARTGPAPAAEPSKQPSAKPPAGAPAAAPTNSVPRQTPVVPPASKPREPRPPVPEPAIGPPRFPMPPSPAPPVVAVPQSASGALEQPSSGLPVGGPPIVPPETPAGRPPSAGSAFPAGRLPFRPASPASRAAAQPPLPGAVSNMPSWNGYMAPGVGVRYRKPRGWWTYTAALGIIAAVGFAGLMMIDPSTISRARLATAVHEPNPNSNVPPAFTTSNPSTEPSSTAPSTNGSPSIPPSPSGSAANGTAGVSPGAKPPQQAASTQSNPNAGNSSQAGTNSGNDGATTHPAVPVNPFDATNSTSGSTANSAPRRKPRETEASSEENKRPKNNEPARESAREESASQPAKNNAAATEPAQPAKEPPASQTQTSPPTSGVANPSNGSGISQQPQPTQPTSPVVSSSSSSSAQVSPAPAQPPATKQDQDDYARTARREGVAGGGNANRAPTQETASAHATTASENPKSSVEVSGERSSPVAPSVPLIGVPSGSVGANSQFRSFRIPPELQSKAAQLAGSLQIGQMLSSYAPSYPVEAARAGVEGIVKLDVMVAPNGNVESVKVISGPPALTLVSISAVKGWHYGETLLGGQPVEAEQYVTLVFRLAK